MKVFIKRNPAFSFGCSIGEGETGDVPDDLGKILVAKGIAECLDEPKPEPGTVEKAEADLKEYREKTIRGVPPKPAIAETKPATIEVPAKEKPEDVEVPVKDKPSAAEGDKPKTSQPMRRDKTPKTDKEP